MISNIRLYQTDDQTFTTTHTVIGQLFTGEKGAMVCTSLSSVLFPFFRQLFLPILNIYEHLPGKIGPPGYIDPGQNCLKANDFNTWKQ